MGPFSCNVSRTLLITLISKRLQHPVNEDVLTIPEAFFKPSTNIKSVAFLMPPKKIMYKKTSITQLLLSKIPQNKQQHQLALFMAQHFHDSVCFTIPGLPDCERASNAISMAQRAFLPNRLGDLEVQIKKKPSISRNLKIVDIYIYIISLYNYAQKHPVKVRTHIISSPQKVAVFK